MAAVGASPQYNFLLGWHPAINSLFTDQPALPITWTNFVQADADEEFPFRWMERAMRIAAIAVLIIPVYLVDLAYHVWARWRAPAFKEALEKQGHLTWHDLQWYRQAIGEPFSSEKITEIRDESKPVSPSKDDVEGLLGLLPNVRKMLLVGSKLPDRIESIDRSVDKVVQINRALLKACPRGLEGLQEDLEGPGHMTWHQLIQFRKRADRSFSSDKITEIRGAWPENLSAEDVEFLIGSLPNVKKTERPSNGKRSPEVMCAFTQKCPGVAAALKASFEAQGYVTWNDLVRYREETGGPFSSDRITELLGDWPKELTVEHVQALIGLLPNAIRIPPLKYKATDKISPDAFLELGKKMPQVRDVSLDLDTENGNAVIPIITLAFPQLRSLEVEYHLKEITESNAALMAIANGCPHFERLRLGSSAVDKGMVVLAQKAKNLTYIDVGRGDLSDQGILAIAENLPKLVSLKAEGTYSDKITDEGLFALAGTLRGHSAPRGCRQLKELDLDSQYKITERGMAQILQYCPLLEKLVLNFCNETVRILDVRHPCHNLREVSMAYVAGITYDLICNFAKMCPKLKKLTFSRKYVQMTEAQAKQLSVDFPNLVLELN